jgi:superfamily II DNA or RNA helicase
VSATGAGYVHTFRRYQQLALDAFELSRALGRERCYVVMPPGSGKTVVGLEIARRLGRRTVVFGPNTAIQSQWAAQWLDFSPPRPAGMSPSLSAQVSVLTYQALCNLDHGEGLDELVGPEDEEDADPAIAPLSDGDRAAERRRRRQLIVNGGDRAALLGLLHPNGRKLIDRMKAAPEITLVLDECHHLLATWGHLVQAVVDELGQKVFVVGLTATPPADMGAREAALYEDLFGRADFDVVTPAVVKEGDLAPYQELAYLTEPLPSELDYMASQSRRFEDLIGALMNPDFASRPFLDWLHQRAVERLSHSGAQLSWERFEQEAPDLALAVLRLFVSRGFGLPKGARTGERHRQPPTSDDWAAMIDDYCQGFLARSQAPGDRQAWESIRRALPSVGYVLTRQGIRSYVSPSDRVLALSASKGVAAQTILDLENQQLGADLRALVLCDFERAGVELLAELRSILDPQAGSASLILQLLVADAATRALSPILLTGRTVACSRATAANLIAWAGDRVPAIAGALAAAPLGTKPNGEEPPRSASRGSGGRRDGSGGGAETLAAQEPAGRWDEVVVVEPHDSWWQPRNYVPLVTRYFEEGRSQCLVGTRGLLGEGWDARTVNVLIDLTAASTSTSVHQMRGRSLRLDARLPHKVADNWDVVCVAPRDARGLGDYRRFVRKHQRYYALTETGEIECGVWHVDPALTPYGPPPEPEIAALNQRTLGRIGRRKQAYAEWGIGRPYRNLETETVRVHFNQSLGLSGRAVPGSGAAGSTSRVFLPGWIATAAGVAAYFGLAAFGPVGLLTAGVAGGVALGWAAWGAWARLRERLPNESLENMAAAVVDGLAGSGGIAKTCTASDLRFVVQPDGYYRCYLEGASKEDSRSFAAALDQVLAPIEDARYIIGRRVVDPPGSRAEAWLTALRFGLGMPGGRIVYHAVPDFLGTRRERVAVFERAWKRRVGGTNALFYRDPKAAGILEVVEGENPFGTTTQLRTLWS